MLQDGQSSTPEGLQEEVRLMPEGVHRSSVACRFMLVLCCSCGLPRCRDTPHVPHRFWHLSESVPRLLPDGMRVSVAKRGGR